MDEKHIVRRRELLSIGAGAAGLGVATLLASRSAMASVSTNADNH